MSSRAVIAGATGLVGGECLRILLNRYDSVTALVRKPTGRLHPKLTERRVDFEKLDTIEIPHGAHVFSALGTTIKKAGSEEKFRQVDYEYPLKLAKASEQAGGAKYVLVSSVAADRQSRNFYLRVKGELEVSIATLKLDAALFFRPSILIGERDESRPLEKFGVTVARGISFALIGPWKKYRPIPAGIVAEAMVAAAESDVHGARIYHYDEMLELARK